jgi:Spy/CpxP family protein refolding chaperone
MSHFQETGMRIRLQSIFVLVLAAWLASPALGQPPFGGRGGGFGGPGMLLQNTGVQKELKLTDEQIQKIKDVAQKIQEKHKDDFAALAKIDQQERREKFQELFKTIGEETEKGLADVLKPEQSKRLKQISLQQRGSQAFNEEDVQKTLKLTDDQKDKIKTLNEDAGKEMREIFQNAQGNFREAGEKAGALRKETMEKVMALLTDEQKKAWKDMTGEPFEVRFEGTRGRIGGRRGPQEKDNQ